MRGFFGFFLLSRLFGNPIVALLVLMAIYFIVDRRFVGLLPDVLKPIRRRGQIRQIRQTLELNPADANAHLELGTVLSAKHRWEEALPHLEQAASRLENSQSFFQLGMAYFRVGRYDEGKQTLERALELNPRVGYGEPYLYFAEYQLHRGENISAIPGLDEALSQYGSVDVCYRLGRLFEQAGDQQKAGEMYREALETYRVNPPFLRRQQRRIWMMAWLRAHLLAR